MWAGRRCRRDRERGRSAPGDEGASPPRGRADQDREARPAIAAVDAVRLRRASRRPSERCSQARGGERRPDSPRVPRRDRGQRAGVCPRAARAQLLDPRRARTGAAGRRCRPRRGRLGHGGGPVAPGGRPRRGSEDRDRRPRLRQLPPQPGERRPADSPRQGQLLRLGRLRERPATGLPSRRSSPRSRPRPTSTSSASATPPGLGQAVNYARAHGITIISHSASWFNTRAGTGTARRGAPEGIVAAAPRRRDPLGERRRQPRPAALERIVPRRRRQRLERVRARGRGEHGRHPAGNAYACAALKWDDWPASTEDYDLYFTRSQRLRGSSPRRIPRPASSRRPSSPARSTARAHRRRTRIGIQRPRRHAASPSASTSSSIRARTSSIRSPRGASPSREPHRPRSPSAPSAGATTASSRTARRDRRSTTG